jgi:hypothetical protein
MANLSGVTTNFYATAQEGFTTTTAGSVSSGAATVPLNSIGSFSNGDIVALTIEPASPSAKQVFTGMVSGTNIVNVKWTEGTNQAHAAGVTVIDYVSATHQALQTKGNLISHNQDGTIKDNTITTAKLANNSVTPSKLSTGAANASVVTSESTTSTLYTDLTTTTDTVTVSIGINGMALVVINSFMQNSVANAFCYLGFSISGASTVAASDTFSTNLQAYAANANERRGTTFLITGLTAGSNTFKLKYRVDSGGSGSGTGIFSDRKISVIPL